MKKLLVVVVCLLYSVLLFSCSSGSGLNYQDDNLWIFKEVDKSKDVDVFFIAPTVSSGSGYLDLNNEKHKSKFLGNVKQEKGIYDTDARFFAPIYRQALMDNYSDTKEVLNEHLNNAYKDIKNAFEYYLNNLNNNHKIIVAGFSQGADMALRLLSDFISNDKFYEKYVSCYAIGWIVDDEFLNKNARLKSATGETDLKSIISFNSEAGDITSSFVVPEGKYSHSINPLNWKTTTDMAAKELNKGAVFINTYGEVTKEVNELTGCYLDSTRGTLKVTDINKDDYKSKISFIADGVYHIYDYQFFYNNLKENVSKRISECLK